MENNNLLYKCSDDLDSYLSELYQKLLQDTEYSFGFPLNIKLDIEDLLPFFNIHLNNFGASKIICRLFIKGPLLKRRGRFS